MKIFQSNHLSLFAMFLLPILSFMIGLIIFYYLLTYLKVECKETYCLLLSLFPLVYTSTIFCNIDTPSYIFLLIVIIIYLAIYILKSYNKISYIKYIELFTLEAILFLILSLVWNKSGAFMVASIFVFSMSLAFIRELKYKILFMFGASLFFFLKVKDKMFSFFSLTNEIQELNHLDYSLYFVLSFISIASIFYLWKKDNKDVRLYEYLFYSFFMFMILSLMMKRFAYLSVIYAVIILALNKSKELRLIIYFILAISIIHIFFGVNEYPIMERPIQHSLESLGGYEIVGDWGYGHIYQAFTKGNVLFKGHPNITKVQTWRKAIDTGNYSLLDTLNTSKIYYVIISNKDTTKIYNVEGFKLINITTGERTSIAILQRGVNNRSGRDTEIVWNKNMAYPSRVIY
jgi:hypothetical protein